jgi:hypothetical protein
LLLLTGIRHGTGSSASWLKALVQDDDKIGGKGSHHSAISAQSSDPPRSVSSIETFNQIAFDKSKVLVCFSSPRIHCPTPAWEASRKLWRSRSHLCADAAVLSLSWRFVCEALRPLRWSVFGGCQNGKEGERGRKRAKEGDERMEDSLADGAE